MSGPREDYAALICITTCRRLGNLRRYLPHFAAFCRSDPRFRLLVALDGTEADYLDFCAKWEVSLVHADRREGVGMSKNRVLERFGGMDHYFFLDDDVELMDGAVFPAHVEMAGKSGIHHFSLFERGGVRRATGESLVDGRRVVHGMFGGGQFSYYTGEGLRRVGGWHPRFAEFKRWGHTEHSYRFWRAGLAPAPFNVAEDLSASCIWHYPPAVTRVEGVALDADQIAAPERELMDQEATHHPVRTLSPHHANPWPPGHVGPLASVLDRGERYPLVTGAERRRCWSDYHLWSYRHTSGAGARLAALVAGVVRSPTNPTLRTLLRARLRARLGR